jgi:MFS family permease
VAERHPACQRIGPIVQGSSLLGILAATPARRIWLAGVAVGVVRWLEMLAFALWGLAATGSPLVVATLALARLLPLLLLAVPLSALLEGRDRRRVMLAALAAMLTSSALMLVAALVDLLSLPLLLAAAFANGIFWTIEQPVRRTLFVETAGLERAGSWAHRASSPARFCSMRWRSGAWRGPDRPMPASARRRGRAPTACSTGSGSSLATGCSSAPCS